VTSASTNFLISFQVFHTSSLPMGTHIEALKFKFLNHACTYVPSKQATAIHAGTLPANVDAYRRHTTAALAYSRHS